EKPSLPDDELIRREMNDCIRNFIEQLPTDYRTVLVLSELEGLKNIQIADILGTTLSIVKIRLHRARTKLKKELESHCSFYRDERNELACDLKTALQDLREE
ncbi:MAG: RNA polymerase sigma factor, partial [Ignavibacteria bacterium]